MMLLIENSFKIFPIQKLVEPFSWLLSYMRQLQHFCNQRYNRVQSEYSILYLLHKISHKLLTTAVSSVIENH